MRLNQLAVNLMAIGERDVSAYIRLDGFMAISLLHDAHQWLDGTQPTPVSWLWRYGN